MPLSGTAASASRRVVVLAGPTAVGKSSLGMRLCESLPGELISVDSVQIYRGLHIGANKPSAAERSRVPHHLIDVADLQDEYTAGCFYRDALTAVESVLSRGKTPVLVGGTSMYLRWFVNGRPTAPRADPAVSAAAHEALQGHQATGDWDGGLERLRALDPERAMQLSRNDWYRLHRALVVAMQTQTHASSILAPDDSDGLDALRASLDMRCFFLTAPRVPLCRRIDARCGDMLTSGLLDEVTELLLSGSLLPSHPAGRAIGYRQTLDYLLRARYAPKDQEAFTNFVHTFAAASRRYAQQQTKWFRSEPEFEWVPANWSAPGLAFAAVASGVARTRAEHEAALADARQVELRAIKTDEGKQMRTYGEAHDVLKDAQRRTALLASADACCARLQPVLDRIAAEDDEIATRYPWHAAGEGGGGNSEAADEGATGTRVGGRIQAGLSRKRPAALAHEFE